MKLQLNDPTNKAGMFQEAERKLFNSNYGRITNDQTTKLDFVARFNNALDAFTNWILKSDTRWQWDDTNHPDYPVFTETLVAGQHDYPYEVEFLQVERMAIKNSDGDFVYLEPVDPRDYSMPLEEFYYEDGMPRVYDKTANSAKIYPAPAADDVTLSEGLKVWTQRVAEYFTVNDDTVVPGVPSIFHEGIVTYACHGYAVDNLMADKRTMLFEELYNQSDGWKLRVEDYYSRRDVDDKPSIGPGRNRRLSKLH